MSQNDWGDDPVHEHVHHAPLVSPKAVPSFSISAVQRDLHKVKRRKDESGISGESRDNVPLSTNKRIRSERIATIDHISDTPDNNCEGICGSGSGIPTAKGLTHRQLGALQGLLSIYFDTIMREMESADKPNNRLIASQGISTSKDTVFAIIDELCDNSWKPMMIGVEFESCGGYNSRLSSQLAATLLGSFSKSYSLSSVSFGEHIGRCFLSLLAGSPRISNYINVLKSEYISSTTPLIENWNFEASVSFYQRELCTFLLAVDCRLTRLEYQLQTEIGSKHREGCGIHYLEIAVGEFERCAKILSKHHDWNEGASHHVHRLRCYCHYTIARLHSLMCVSVGELMRSTSYSRHTSNFTVNSQKLLSRMISVFKALSYTAKRLSSGEREGDQPSQLRMAPTPSMTRRLSKAQFFSNLFDENNHNAETNNTKSSNYRILEIGASIARDPHLVVNDLRSPPTSVDGDSPFRAFIFELHVEIVHCIQQSINSLSLELTLVTKTSNSSDEVKQSDMQKDERFLFLQGELSGVLHSLSLLYSRLVPDMLLVPDIHSESPLVESVTLFRVVYIHAAYTARLMFNKLQQRYVEGCEADLKSTDSTLLRVFCSHFETRIQELSFYISSDGWQKSNGSLISATIEGHTSNTGVSALPHPLIYDNVVSAIASDLKTISELVNKESTSGSYFAVISKYGDTLGKLVASAYGSEVLTNSSTNLSEKEKIHISLRIDAALEVAYHLGSSCQVSSHALTSPSSNISSASVNGDIVPESTGLLKKCPNKWIQTANQQFSRSVKVIISIGEQRLKQLTGVSSPLNGDVHETNNTSDEIMGPSNISMQIGCRLTQLSRCPRQAEISFHMTAKTCALFQAIVHDLSQRRLMSATMKLDAVGSYMLLFAKQIGVSNSYETDDIGVSWGSKKILLTNQFRKLRGMLHILTAQLLDEIFSCSFSTETHAINGGVLSNSFFHTVALEEKHLLVHEHLAAALSCCFVAHDIDNSKRRRRGGIIVSDPILAVDIRITRATILFNQQQTLQYGDSTRDSRNLLLPRASLAPGGTGGAVLLKYSQLRGPTAESYVNIVGGSDAYISYSAALKVDLEWLETESCIAVIINAILRPGGSTPFSQGDSRGQKPCSPTLTSSSGNVLEAVQGMFQGASLGAFRPLVVRYLLLKASVCLFESGDYVTPAQNLLPAAEALLSDNTTDTCTVDYYKQYLRAECKWLSAVVLSYEGKESTLAMEAAAELGNTVMNLRIVRNVLNCSVPLKDDSVLRQYDEQLKKLVEEPPMDDGSPSLWIRVATLLPAFRPDYRREFC